MSDPSYVVRRADRSEIGTFRAWAAAEGWNPGPNDVECFYETDPHGFFVGKLSGEIVSIISCVAYDDSYGFVGHYITKPEFRGKGFGIQVWRAGLAYLGDRIVGLDGVVAQQDNYRKSGFVLAYNNVRYRGEGGGAASPNVVPLSNVPFSQLETFDRQRYPAPRSVFLRRWIAMPGAIALARLEGSQLLGYGVMRPATEGYRIGPLFAVDYATADELFRSFLAQVPGQTTYVDCPDVSVNPGVAELVRRFRLMEGFPTARMYTRSFPSLKVDQVYGVTSLELG